MNTSIGLLKHQNGDEEWSKIFDSKVVKLVKISGVFTASKTMNDSGKTMNINKYSIALSARKNSERVFYRRRLI